MRNIQPWCISRQIWWGHQIPAWYAPDGKIFVEETEADAREAAQLHYGKVVALERDGDVLDTWFSSALWPFSTLGWPEKTAALARYYPTDVLVTGFDIIFFWVARMMMMGCKFMDDVPFRTVYIHALVRDERGQKMSKSKGNIVDPLAVIERYGCDALRFTLAALAAPGRDVKLAESRIEGYRNFGTKLWNAARYAEMNRCVLDPRFDPKGATLTANRWIAAALAETAQRTAAAIEAYKFNDAAGELYHFIWHTYCDWYLEFTKPILTGIEDAGAAETRAMTAWVLGEIVHLLHPIMPFVTETLWRHLAGDGAGLLIAAPWPAHADLGDAAAMAEMEWVVGLIAAIRTARAEMNVPAGQELAALITEANADGRTWIARHAQQICRLARLSAITEGDAAQRRALHERKAALQIVVEGATVLVDLAGSVDLDRERARLAREAGALADELDKIAKKLANPQFIAKAKVEIVEEQRGRETEARAARARIEAALARIGGA
jgi:valyl-tRNA synthetase